jgi:methylated-DNA-protein-cysteine methyltransferase-like protein
MTSIPDKHKDFFNHVFEVVRLIPEGRVTNYGSIAKALGSAKSSRMVGWAMNASHSQKEPVPAHRVVNRIGLLTGKAHFNPPSKMQEDLEKEGIEVKEDKITNFKELFWDPSIELEL